MKHQEGRDSSPAGKRSGKESSSAAKARAMNELYEKLETPEGERKISRIAKAKDFAKNNQIKDEQRVVLRDLDSILGRWNGLFDKLLNGENHRFAFDDVEPNDGLTQGIGRNEVLKSNVITNEEGRNNGNGWIPRDVWMCLGEEWVDMLSIR